MNDDDDEGNMLIFDGCACMYCHYQQQAHSKKAAAKKIENTNKFNDFIQF